MLHTALYDQHIAQKAKMVPFAGYQMPIQYQDGIIEEHLHVRRAAGLFDVSHMGQLLIEGDGATQALSRLVPTDLTRVPLGKAVYTVLTNDQGGIIDDLIITRIEEDILFVVINASRKEIDTQWITSHLPAAVHCAVLSDRSLLALQGPKAEEVLVSIMGNKEALSKQAYMSVAFYNYPQFQSLKQHLSADALQSNSILFVSRLGYTGEDGFEISVANVHAAALFKKLLAHAAVKPVGLGARDTLRLEMGYPLYGNDIDETTNPIEASLKWVMSKDHHDYHGASVIEATAAALSRKRVGIQLLEKGVMRAGYPLVLEAEGKTIGTLTSGGFSPSIDASFGQAYIDLPHASKDTELFVLIRNKPVRAKVTALACVKASTK